MHRKILSLSHKRQLHAKKKPLNELIKEVLYFQELRNKTKEIWEDTETMAILRNEVYLSNKTLIEATEDYMKAKDELGRAIKKVKKALGTYEEKELFEMEDNGKKYTVHEIRFPN